MSLHVTGKAGSLRVGGRVAATLEDWSFRKEDPPQVAWHITARAVDQDSLLLEAGIPIEVRLILAKDVWRWKGVQIEGEGSIVVRGEGSPDIL